MPALASPSGQVPPSTLSLSKLHVVGALLLLQLWPLAVIVNVIRLAPAYAGVFHMIGDHLPWSTTLVLATSAWWWLAPVCTTAMSLATLHPGVKTLRLPACTLVLTLISGLLGLVFDPGSVLYPHGGDNPEIIGDH